MGDFTFDGGAPALFSVHLTLPKMRVHDFRNTQQAFSRGFPGSPFIHL